MATDTKDQETRDQQIKEAVRANYGSIAREVAKSTQPASCCGAGASCGCGDADAERKGNAGLLYVKTDLTGLPASVTGASLGCGNPTAIAGLKPGEVVLDLGSGGGIDCFLAAQKVGPTGRVIGLDMTPDMLKLAQHNAKLMHADNVEFRFGEMEDIPLPDASVDVIISNCVINLSTDKDSVFKEAYRVLRPGGRMTVSDMVVQRELPPAIRGRLDAWASCVAGALSESDYLARIRAAGFRNVEVESRDYLPITQIPEGGSEEQVIRDVAGGLGMDEAEARAILAECGLSARDLMNMVASIRVKSFKA
jgi:arsenite methyltransferase